MIQTNTRWQQNYTTVHCPLVGTTNERQQHIFGFIQSSTKLFYTTVCLKTQYYCLERKKWKAFVTYFFFTITFDRVVNLMCPCRIKVFIS